MTTIVTGWTGRGYDVLGEQFIRTFKAYWPADVRLMVYTDEGEHGHYLAECDGLAEFIARHADNPVAHGVVPTEAGYSFRTDAVKFATQLFIPEAAAKHLPDGEVLVWFDADVLTKRPVPEGFVEALMGDADVVYLGRPPKHSEIGFWAVRLGPITHAFLTRLADTYRTDDVFTLAETHSAYVFDSMASFHVHYSGMERTNITPGGHGHVWPASPLGRYCDHLKGKRKLSVMRRAA